MKCVKCNSKMHGRFCCNCGHSQELQRIDGQYVLSEIKAVLNFDGGILYTIKELLLRPGLNIRKFILEDIAHWRYNRFFICSLGNRAILR